MVLEQIIQARRLERNPSLILAISFLFVSFAIILTNYFYPSDRGMVVLLLTIMPAIPFFLNFIRHEERRHERENDDPHHSIFTIYRPLIALYFFYFIGSALSFGFWFSILPEQQANSMFADVMQEYGLLRSSITGNFLSLNAPVFMHILCQNLLVLSLMMIFSFVYSIGSIFLLTWNAALLGVLIANTVRALLPTVSQQFGIFAFPVAFIGGAGQALLGIMPHGIFEIGAFFVASLSGGILSVALERGTYRRRAFWNIIYDAAKLFALSLVLVVLGAAIESLYAG
ncbi:MAG: stage II sporulation protein M [Candidatus Micrarchaeia archaeon]|jgi:uncharacterized membrane protein SpoIIM required for sporulation